MKIDFVLASSADPDEMPHYVAFHLGLHCLPKHPFRGFRHRKGYIYWRALKTPYLIPVLSYKRQLKVNLLFFDGVIMKWLL